MLFFLLGYPESDPLTIAAEAFGYHFGMAFQIVDDILDFTGASAILGKPAQADMELGLATAPILYASEVNKNLIPLIQRRFKEKGDIQKAVELASNTNSVQKSYELADFHAKSAIAALSKFPPSDARSALTRLLHVAISRSS
jgi:geranylgeranyl pyrophosphate synthase